MRFTRTLVVKAITIFYHQKRSPHVILHQKTLETWLSVRDAEELIALPIHPSWILERLVTEGRKEDGRYKGVAER